MIKILQKYKMYILVVAGVLIITSFLLADLLRQIGQSSSEGARVYTVGGEKVTLGELQKAESRKIGISRAIPLWKQLVDAKFFDDDSTQWQLVTANARKAGLLGGPADGRAAARAGVIERLQQESIQSQRDANATQFVDWRTWFKNQTKLNDDELQQRIDMLTDQIVSSAAVSGRLMTEGAHALAEWRSIQRLMQSYENVAQTSENRMAAEGRRLLDEAVIKYLYVPVTDAQIATAAAPTPEQLQAQFDKYKDVLVGGGPDGTGFGYRQSDRISLTWITVDKAAVSRAMSIDPVEVQQRAQGRAASDPTTLRRQVEDELRGEQTEKALDAFTSAFRSEIIRTTAMLPEKDGYKVLPTEWKKPDLTAVAKAAVDRLAAEKKINFPMPTVSSSSKPLDPRAFSQQTGVGNSMISRPGQQPVFLGSVLFGAKELNKPAGKIAAQVGLPLTTPFTGAEGAIYFAMLDSVLPSASPASLDEVREEVERDVRRTNSVAKLKADLEARLPTVAVLGMSEAVEQLKALGYPGLAVQSGRTRRSGYRLEQFNFSYFVQTESGSIAQREVQNKEFVEATMSRADKIDPSMKVPDDTAFERTFVHATGEGVIVAQVVGLRPMTQEMFQYLLSTPGFRATVEHADAELKLESRPFSTESLIQRLGVTGLESKPTKATEPASPAVPGDPVAPAPR